METEKRLIELSAAKKRFDGIPPFIGMTGKCVQEMLDEVPTVDAVEVVHGRWERKTVDHWIWAEVCSICGFYGDTEYNYCPNCGAKMDGDGNG